jgi:flagellar protein FliS
MTQNAMAYHANNAYRSAAVAVPPLKAVVMLCDGAITFLQKALDAHEAKRFED